MRDNYQIARENAEKLFVQMDQDALIRLHALHADTDYIYLAYLGQDFRISRADGRVELDGRTPRRAGFGETLAIFDYLSHAPAIAALPIRCRMWDRRSRTRAGFTVRAPRRFSRNSN